MLQLPECFGKSWDARAVECAGGLDPSYAAPDGSNKQPRCPYFIQCASRTAAHKNQQLQLPQPQVPTSSYPSGFNTRPLTPAQALVQVRPPAPVQPQQLQPAQVSVPVQHLQQPTMMVPPPQAMVPGLVPMNFAPPYMQMTGYLTVPEPVVPGQHWGKRLGFSVIRSMIKAGGHTVANFFDHCPLSPWPGNNGQG